MVCLRTIHDLHVTSSALGWRSFLLFLAEKNKFGGAKHTLLEKAGNNLVTAVVNTFFLAVATFLLATYFLKHATGSKKLVIEAVTIPFSDRYYLFDSYLLLQTRDRK